MDEKIKILIVDDAAFMRKTIRKIIESESGISVVGTAKNGQEAIKMNNELLPDVITLDIDMPVMDGITALKHIMVQRPVPVIIVSSLSYETNVTFEAFRLGIIDFIPKPTGAISKELEKQKAHLCHTIVMASGVNVSKLHRIAVQSRQEESSRKPVPASKVVIIGSSLGGPSALIRILHDMPQHTDFAIVAMMQMSSKVMDSFIQRLDKICRINVQKGRGEKILSRGEIYLHTLDQPCPSIIREGDNYLLKYRQEIPDFPIDQVMENSTRLDRLQAGGVLLAGCGQDGLAGLAKIHEKSGKAIVQKTTSAVFPEKPRLAVQKGVYGQVANDDEIAEQMVKMMSSS